MSDDDDKNLIPILSDDDLRDWTPATYPTQADGDMLRPATVLTLPPWTSDTPTHEGLYRYREPNEARRKIEYWRYVHRSYDGNVYSYRFGAVHRVNAAELRGEWAGPIEVSE